MKSAILHLFGTMSLLVATSLTCFGQNIPDVNFANAIRTQCPTCIDGSNNLLAPATSLTGLTVSNASISSLQGIAGFTNLDTLCCDNNQLYSLPTLPNSLTYLNCYGNQLDSLPTLPNSLAYLYCGNNHLISLPSLPNSLTILSCHNNNLPSLPTLPNSLTHLECNYNNLTSLPTLPNSLLYFHCINNQLSSLPTLPNSLTFLNCSANPLQNLPSLPNSISSLSCLNNQLTSLPTLPTSLFEFACSHNQLTSLPALPTSLWQMECINNQLTSLPVLPASLADLYVTNNQLINLPTLPTNIRTLWCDNNQLTSLPTLPNSLQQLYCNNNDLTSLPTLPDSLTYLDYSNNPNLVCLPQLPSTLTYLVDTATSITCLPNIPSGIAATNNLPVCASNNPNNCAVFTQLSGTIYLDFNTDCARDTTDSSARANILVQAIDGVDTFYTYTNPFGEYAFSLPVGTYTVQAQPTPDFFYNICSASVSIISPSSFVVQDLGIQPLFSCPLLEVEIQANRLRRCFSGFYDVVYQNTGTIVANNAYIDVTLDNFLTYTSNSLNLTPTNLGNNVYRFNVGTVSIGQQVHFTIGVDVSCTAQLGQVHCTEAHIYPDTICGLNWTDPIIEILDTCLTDSILFRLTNTGGNMTIPQTYQIIEDNYIYRPDANFLLNNGQFLEVVIPAAPNKVYRMEATQAINFPAILGNPTAWAIVQNCNGISSNLVNYINQFYTGNIALAIDNDCAPNRGSYDPNEKSAQQIGYGNQHLIAKNTPLDYKIEFQNTGTDTAFRVVVLDTLDNNVLDVTSIRIGTSSHNFTWTLLENHILKFTFDNILLVDSFSNEPASHGYVTFNIKQQPDLANGTIINNKAAIYFDFNAPVITNTCFHTIGEHFVVVANKDISMPNADVKVYPNPFQTQTTFEVSGVQYQQLMLKLTDVLGNEIRTLQTSNNQLQLDRNQLPSGLYFYQLYVDDVLLNTGKIVAQ